MPTFGARLKQAREARGVSLRQIATATKFSIGVLEALERNDLSRLPAGIFSRAFVRAYAIEVGLDPDQTVNDFLVELDKHEREAARVLPRYDITKDDREFLERQRRAGLALRAGLIAVAFVIVALLIWRFGLTAR